MPCTSPHDGNPPRPNLVQQTPPVRVRLRADPKRKRKDTTVDIYLWLDETCEHSSSTSEGFPFTAKLTLSKAFICEGLRKAGKVLYSSAVKVSDLET